MNPIIIRETKYEANREITTICVFGVPLFKRIIDDTEEKTRRPCGFNPFPSNAPGHFISEFNEDDGEWDDTGCKSHDSNGEK